MYVPHIEMVTPKELTAGRVLKFAFLPGILPRLQSLAGVISRFMFSFTQVFGTVGLIDKNHPCLRPVNIGRYRFFDVLGLAFYGLLQDRKNLNKILVFAMTMATIVMITALAAVSVAMVVTKIPQAHAQLTDTYFTDTTDTNYDEREDLAYIFLSELFGNTGFKFWGETSTNNTAGLQDKNVLFGPIIRAMFSTYSQALLIIAILMIIYNIVIMVAESARTGEPFGEKFNSVWAPVRLALAIGLLVPISQGYNTAQLMTFQISAWGSALATNVWTKGLSAFGTDPNNASQVDAAAEKLVMAMQPGHGYSFMRGIFMTNLCLMGLNQGGGSVGAPENLFGGLVGGGVDDDGIIGEGNTEGLYRYFQGGTYLSGTATAVTGILLGPAAGLVAANKAVNVDYCGGYKIPDPDEFAPQQIKLIGGEPVSLVNGGGAALIGHLPHLIAQRYNAFYQDANLFTKAASQKIIQFYMNDEDKNMQDMTDASVVDLHKRLLNSYQLHMGYRQMTCPVDDPGCDTTRLPWMYFQDEAGNPNGPFRTAARQDGAAIIAVLNSGKKWGWASAGSIMMMLAHLNNVVSSAVNSPPAVTSLPRLLTNPLADPWFRNESVSEGGFFGWFRTTMDEKTKKLSKTLGKASTWFADWPVTKQADGETIASAHHMTLSAWRAEVKDRSGDNQTDLDLMAAGGMQGFLLSFVEMNVENMNPLAQVVSIGSGLFTVASAMVVVGLIANIWIPGSFSLAFSLALPLTIGAYMLCVVLPFALFANFMFAVIEWVISVFEAVVGMPLFALSFISVSGEGIGDKAMSGVMKLVELMLRPSIIVIAAVGAMMIFSAAVHFFNRSFMLFMQSYFDSTDGVIKNGLVVFGSIFMYVMTVYTIGNSTFKLIPTIANSFMRWIDGPEGFSKTMDFQLNEAAGLGVLIATTGMARGVAGVVSKGMDGVAADNKQSRDNEAYMKNQYDAYKAAGGKDDYKTFKSDARDLQKMSAQQGASGMQGAGGYGPGLRSDATGAARGDFSSKLRGNGGSPGGSGGADTAGSSGGGSNNMTANAGGNSGAAPAPNMNNQYNVYKAAGGKDNYAGFARDANAMRKMEKQDAYDRMQFEIFKKAGGKGDFASFKKDVEEMRRLNREARNKKDPDKK
jgi:hypothetical protein